jgi:flagellum-specific ATP synthase
MTLDKPNGVRFGDRIVTWGAKPSLRVGPDLRGRVIDATGNPIDGLPEYQAERCLPVDDLAPSPLDRVLIDQPLTCGIRAIDGFLTCGRGQRIGIFGGSGVGKSTLLGMMARGTTADLTVLALVGERGREVGEFLSTLGEEGRQRSVVVVSTSDQSPLLRIRAALSATAVAEYFCGQGKNVLLVVDSLTRFAMAQREIGLAAGEPPTAKGYTPSVLSMLARLVERAGRFSTGSITAFYTVLMEGDDQQDPIVDTIRSLLDGHVVLSRSLALRNQYPPISVLESLSRLMPSVCTAEHLQRVGALRTLVAAYQNAEDLVRIGAYQKGSDPILDKAIAALPEINRFLRQTPTERTTPDETLQQLFALPS